MSIWPKKGILGILQRQLEIYMNEKSAGRNAKQKPMRRRGTPLTSNKRRGAGDLFFTARIGRTKNPGALRNRKKVLGSPFPGGCNKFSLDVGVRRRRSARPSKEHEFCAASLTWEPLKRARVRSIRVVGTEVSVPGGRGWTTTRQWLSRKRRQRPDDSRLSTGGLAMARKRTIMPFDFTKDDVLIFIHPRREIRSLKKIYTRLYISGCRSETRLSAEVWDTRSTRRRSQDP